MIIKNDNCTWATLPLFCRKKTRPTFAENTVSQERLIKKSYDIQEVLKTTFDLVKISSRSLAFVVFIIFSFLVTGWVGVVITSHSMQRYQKGVKKG